jgi:hypothetical protein
VESYELEWEDTRPKTAANIVKKHLTRPDTSDSGVDTGEDGDKFIDRLDDATIHRVLVPTFFSLPLQPFFQLLFLRIFN